ncbi:MAG: ABC transporter permease [Sphaerochaetaceae bacterium]|nr:ABC transporter permease [Sphaerochaetaceae bacterium]MDC7237266.1 ABC transporter permease [Sphaerochaetaceae bacterium]MDC7250603.1 ABC transporter permease [Sphaerochaetaceae bacterium]
MSNQISYLGIFYLILLIIPTLYINYILSVKMNKRILISVVRMIIQLSLVGLYLQYIFDLNNQILNVTYILIMMLVASISITNSTPLKKKKLYFPIFISMVIPNLFMVLFFNKMVINLNNIFDARYIITIGGMLLGNVLSGDIVGLNSFFKDIEDNKKIINYDLALGASLNQALKPYVKNSLTSSITPTVSSMATIGLVSLPGMMTGQILGGSVPLEAIMYQIAIMIAIYVTRYFNILSSIYITNKYIFDNRGQMYC